MVTGQSVKQPFFFPHQTQHYTNNLLVHVSWSQSCQRVLEIDSCLIDPELHHQ